MKINSLCELIKVYDAILFFYIDTGYGELNNLTPSPALSHFLDSYSKLGTLISYWEAHGMLSCEKLNPERVSQRSEPS